MINFEPIELFVIGFMAFAFLMAVMLGIARLAEQPSSGLHAFGNVVTTAPLAVARGPGRSSTGSTTSVAAVDGVASLTSESLTLGPAAARQLVLQQTPKMGTAGQALSTALKVAVEDAFGNRVTGDNSTVSAAVATGPGSFAAGSTTSVAASRGVATFSNLILDTSGKYTLSLSDGTLTGALTGRITVVAAAASQLVIEQSPTSGTAGQALSALQVAVEDAFGNVANGDSSTVSVTVASGPGGFAAGSTTSVKAVNGVATFSNLVLDTAGTYTLKATAGSLSSATSRNITMGAASASQLVLQQVPTSGTAGQALGALNVAVEDAFGNVVTNDSSTVTVAVASGPGGFAAGSTTSVAAVGVVATFSNLILKTAGVYTLRLSDGALSSATTGTITISPAAPSHLVLQQSAMSGTAGQALGALNVAVEDAFGNVVTNDGSTVTVAVASGPGRFAAGSTTSVAAVNGVATFNNLVLDTTGRYTLSVTHGGLTGASTGSITISAAGTRQLVLQQSPKMGTAGQALGALKVAAADAFGNVLTSCTSMLTITVASGPGGFAAGSMTSMAAVNGVATFANLVLNTSGSYTLKATNGTLTSLTSEPLTVGPAPASQLVLQQSPTTGTAGESLSTAVTVAVADAFGNVITTDAFVYTWRCRTS